MNFFDWYTDTVDIWRVESNKVGNITRNQRVEKYMGLPCRVYRRSKGNISMGTEAAKLHSTDKLACDTGVDICKGDELLVHRGAMLGRVQKPERYFAGEPLDLFDPLGGVDSGMEHKEVCISGRGWT